MTPRSCHGTAVESLALALSKSAVQREVLVCFSSRTQLCCNKSMAADGTPIAALLPMSQNKSPTFGICQCQQPMIQRQLGKLQLRNNDINHA